MSISGERTHENPFRYREYIPTEVKPFFVRTVVILGGEPSGKPTPVNKLTNILNTTSTWEYGRDYVSSHLGGNEMALQYSDYDKITLGQTQHIDFAVGYANRMAFIDTDFVTTQASCKKYERREHPFVQALTNEHRFDLMVLLENDTPRVADGLHNLGSSVGRKAFRTLLVETLQENNINFVYVQEPDYDGRFLYCAELVKGLMGEQRQVLEAGFNAGCAAPIRPTSRTNLMDRVMLCIFGLQVALTSQTGRRGACLAYKPH